MPDPDKPFDASDLERLLSSPHPGPDPDYVLRDPDCPTCGWGRGTLRSPVTGKLCRDFFHVKHILLRQKRTD